ncbi:MAG: carboxylating nicotinate-nucleotide diphosphorylase [Phycisphaeraceae bacterium]|nr:carboxylating nicotinate-nucleotide diphosphorylase [Phycisphaeraceae bacterium]
MSAGPPPPDDDALDALLRRAREEDLGPTGRDLTSDLLIDPEQAATARFVTRDPGTLCGLALLPRIAALYDPDLAVALHCDDGDAVATNTRIADVRGSLRSILAFERVGLNFLTHLSGVATLTSQFVEAVSDTGAQIADSRKTLPGLRTLQKWAVRCGGGINHRMGLHDAVLVKDNHLTGLSGSDLTNHLRDVISRARAADPPADFVEVEIDHLDQLTPVMEAGPGLILLDNFTPDQLRQAVERRNQQPNEIKLEASGGITLATAAEIAATGVDRLAIGALTHSAPALDIGLDRTDD